MKAITICQPYAWLFTLPATDGRHKRVENREWYTNYRGPLLIHAGKSRSWLDTWDDITPRETAGLIYGAIVARARLGGCVTLNALRDMIRGGAAAASIHAEGPFCWILTEVSPIAPVYCSGKQGLWEWDERKAFDKQDSSLFDREYRNSP
jgi:hypothetical protein